MSLRRFAINKTLLFKFLSISLSGLCVLAVSEIIIDHLPRKLLPHAHSRKHIFYSPELGLITNEPNSIQVVSSPWVYNKVTYNNYGFRGPNWPLQKKPGETRIAILGDSYIEGPEVAFDELLTSVLETRIGSGTVVMNFGLSGSGQAEQIPLYRNLVTKFKPDVVIHCVTVSNDFEDNVQELSPLQSKNFLKLKDGELIEIPPPQWVTCICKEPWCAVTNFFSNLSLFKLVYRQLDAKKSAPWESFFAIGSACAADKRSSLNRLEAFDTPEYGNAKRVMAKALLNFRTMCEKDGAHFLLMSPSGLWTFLAREEPNLKTKSEHLAKRYTWLEEFAREHSFAYLDLNKSLLQESLSIGLRCDDIHIPWDAHWTPLGHRLAAESACEMLKSYRLIP